MLKTAAIIVIFFPDSDVIDNVKCLVRQCDWLIIVDNGSDDRIRDSLQQISHDHKHIELITNPENLGIATALNQGFKCATAHQAQWVLTMDQDTRVGDDFMSSLTRLISQSEPTEKIGVLGANYIDSTGVVMDSSFDTDGCHHVKTAITSGSLVNLEAWQEVDGFREDFFIDCVDHDFCFRLRRKNWEIKLTDIPLMNHQLGHPHRNRFLWMNLAVPNYTPVRRYYMTRNRIALFKSHWLYEPFWVTGQLLHIGGDALRIMVHEKSRFSKIMAMLRGVRDGLLNRMGQWH
jgi:rhamnosyltransferase